MNTSQNPANLNQLYIDELLGADESSVFGKLKMYWWEHYLKGIEDYGQEKALDMLDEFMRLGNVEFRKSATTYAISKGHTENTEQYIQAINQYLKSNTGKMFERFIGLTLAYALFQSNSEYCVLPFRTDTIKYCHELTKKDFSITVDLGGKLLPTFIDADLIAFNPKNPNAKIYMISVKSTLKDRFHNVPFWNLLRKAAVSEDFPNIVAGNRDLLEKVQYVAICTDLAEQQPDFAAESGPRNLLCVDAALLDGAFVSASRAKGLGNDSGNVIGGRNFAFYPLSRFFSVMR